MTNIRNDGQYCTDLLREIMLTLPASEQNFESGGAPQAEIDPAVRARLDETLAIDTSLDPDERVIKYIPLAKSIAGRFNVPALDYEDKVQQVMLSVIKCAKTFDPSRGVQLDTFIYANAAGNLRNFARDKSWLVRPYRRLQELHLSVVKESEELSQKLGRSPTNAEIAEKLHIDIASVAEAIQMQSARRPTSLDRASSVDRKHTIGDNLESGDRPFTEVIEEQMMLQSLIDQLKAREKAAIEMYYFQNLKQRDIAEKLGISQMHVSRLVRRAVNNLRSLMLEDTE